MANVLVSADPTKRDFTFFAGPLEALKKALKGDDGVTKEAHYLRAPASSTIKDRMGDEFLESAIASMQASAKRLTIYLNHSYTVPEDIFGTCEDSRVVRVKDDKTGVDVLDLIIETRVIESNERAMQTWNAVKNGARLGYSVGVGNIELESGETPTAEEMFFGDGMRIKNCELLEISVVGIPAQQRAIIEEASYALRKRLGLTMTNDQKRRAAHADRRAEQRVAQRKLLEAGFTLETPEPSGVSLYGPGKSHASSLIAAGKYTTESGWSFSGDDGNAILGDKPGDAEWKEYASWHLGHDPAEGGDDTKGVWKYPFGKGGQVWRAGLIAAKQRAAQQGASAISDAAGELVDAIDKKEGKPGDEGEKTLGLLTVLTARGAITNDERAQLIDAVKRGRAISKDTADKLNGAHARIDKAHDAIDDAQGAIKGKNGDNDAEDQKNKARRSNSQRAQLRLDDAHDHLDAAQGTLKDLAANAEDEQPPMEPNEGCKGGKNGERDLSISLSIETKQAKATIEELRSNAESLRGEVAAMQRDLETARKEHNQLQIKIADARATPLGRKTRSFVSLNGDATRTNDPERRRHATETDLHNALAARLRGESPDPRLRSVPTTR